MPRPGRPKKIDQMDRALGGRGMTLILARHLDAEGHTYREIGNVLTARTAISIGHSTVRNILRETDSTQERRAIA